MILPGDNYTRIADAIRETALKAGRDPESIRIIAVSKTVTAPAVQEAIDGGIHLFGENRVQEAKTKIAELKGEFSFHLVGHLQSNKARDAVRLFDLIHSIDKSGTAEKVDEEAGKAGKVQKILVQVNTSREESKAGVDPEGVEELCRAVLRMPNLELLGLMTIGPFTDDMEPVRESFALLRKLLMRTNANLGTGMKELSMGMSSDYRIAVAEGATMVRIGTAIFGSRA